MSTSHVPPHTVLERDSETHRCRLQLKDGRVITLHERTCRDRFKRHGLSFQVAPNWLSPLSALPDGFHFNSRGQICGWAPREGFGDRVYRYLYPYPLSHPQDALLSCADAQGYRTLSLHGVLQRQPVGAGEYLSHYEAAMQAVEANPRRFPRVQVERGRVRVLMFRLDATPCYVELQSKQQYQRWGYPRYGLGACRNVFVGRKFWLEDGQNLGPYSGQVFWVYYLDLPTQHALPRLPRHLEKRQ